MNATDLPDKLTRINTESWIRITVYTILFVLSIVGNYFALSSLWKIHKHSKSFCSLNILLIHLCIADLTVSFAYIGVEVCWRISIGWYAGNILCKTIQFLRAFGFYLSSFIVMCISLDRYRAVVYPLKLRTHHFTSQRIILCWMFAVVFAVPQLVIFRIETHPNYPAFKQCQTRWLGETVERINTALSLIIVYVVPLGVITFSYGNLLFALFSEKFGSAGHVGSILRRHGHSLMEKAKMHSLKLSVMIMLAFLICWTPYVVINSWHMLNRTSAEKLDVKLQDSLFLMVCLTPCVNSFIYGIFKPSPSDIHSDVVIPQRQGSISYSTNATAINLIDRRGGILLSSTSV